MRKNKVLEKLQPPGATSATWLLLCIAMARQLSQDCSLEWQWQCLFCCLWGSLCIWFMTDKLIYWELLWEAGNSFQLIHSLLMINVKEKPSALFFSPLWVVCFSHKGTWRCCFCNLLSSWGQKESTVAFSWVKHCQCAAQKSPATLASSQPKRIAPFLSLKCHWSVTY